MGLFDFLFKSNKGEEKSEKVIIIPHQRIRILITKKQL